MFDKARWETEQQGSSYRAQVVHSVIDIGVSRDGRNGYKESWLSGKKMITC